MIGHIEHGSDFGGLFRYLLAEDKGARIIGGLAAGRTPSELTQEFNNCADQRRTTKKPVKHLIISFAAADGYGVWQRFTHFSVISTLNLMLARISDLNKSTNIAEKTSNSAMLSIPENEFVEFELFFHNAKITVFGKVLNKHGKIRVIKFLKSLIYMLLSLPAFKESKS